MRKNILTWVVCALGLISVAPTASADIIDLGATPYLGTLPEFTANDLGDNDRTVILDALTNVTISSLGVKLDPLTNGPFTLGAVIYAMTTFNTTTYTRGALLASLETTFPAPADLGMGFYEIPIAFSFVANTRYEIGVYAVPTFGTSLFSMALQHFDQSYCASHAIACPPYNTAGNEFKIFEGGACADGAPAGPPDCVGSSSTYLNDNFPHLQLTTARTVVPEPGTISLLSVVCVGLVGAAMRKRAAEKQLVEAIPTAGRRDSSSPRGLTHNPAFVPKPHPLLGSTLSSSGLWPLFGPLDNMIPRYPERRSSAPALVAFGCALGLILAAQGCQSSALQGRDFFVSPMGHANALGTIEDPWDLQTALSHPKAVLPSDTIWLRGGTYRGVFNSNLKGEPERPIIVRNYHDERATIDTGALTGAALNVTGADTWYWGLEVMSSDPKRTSAQEGSEPTDVKRASGVEVSGPRTKFINMVVHDVTGGYGFWTPAEDSEIYGGLIYYNGWAAPDRGHGHGVYAQNRSGKKTIADNIAFSNFGMGLRAYGSENAFIDNVDFVGNASFNAGILYGSPPLRWSNFFVSVGSGASNVLFDSNYAYHLPTDNQGGSMLGWVFSGVEKNIIARNNYWVGGIASIEVWNWNDVTFEKNVSYSNDDLVMLLNHLPLQDRTKYRWDRNAYYGSDLMRLNGKNTRWSQWREITGLDAHSTHQPGRPKGTWSFVRPNKYEQGRANIVIYNWDLLDQVSVDLSEVLSKGKPFEIRDAQNFYAKDPVAKGTYQGGAIKIPMKGLVAASPAGMKPPPHTGPEFAVFVVTKGSQTSAPGNQ